MGTYHTINGGLGRFPTAVFSNINKLFYAKYSNIVAMAFMALLIPFDFFLFNDPLVFVRFRLLLIPGFALNLLVLDTREFSVEGHEGLHLDATLLTPGLSFNLLYAYFLFMTHGDSYTHVLFSNCMVIFVSTFFLHRYWREQVALNIAGIMSMLLVAAYRPEIIQDCLLLIILHLSSFVTAFFFRRDFVDSFSD